MFNQLKKAAHRSVDFLRGNTINGALRRYKSKFARYAFVDCECESQQQFEASIIRLYHTIEKGLSYEDYRPGFGRDNINKLIISLEQYSERGFDTNAFFYRTALSCLNEYVDKNVKYGLVDNSLRKRIDSLKGEANTAGGVMTYTRPEHTDKMNFEQLVTNRHSIRHFSDKPVDIDKLKKAIALAQYTPSACNRQGWKTIIVTNKSIIEKVLANQNGNKGFGQEFDKLLLVTADLRYQQRKRELFQAYIDGGMYAENLLNALFYEGIGSVPLSAALTYDQEKKVRSIIGLDDAEVLILFIGIGNYPEGSFLNVRSERKECQYIVI